MLSVGVIVTVPIAYLLFGQSYLASVLAFVVGYCLATGLGSWWCRPWISPRSISKAAIWEMLPFGWYNFLCGVGFFFTSSIQRPILKYYLSSTEVGQYSLYTMASLDMATYGGTVLATVFFPIASRSSDRAGLWTVTWRAWLKVIWLLIAGLFATQVVAVLLSGRSEYPLDFGLIGVFAVTAGVLVVQNSLGQIIGAEGVRGARLGVAMSLFVGFTNVGLSLLLIPAFHIYGAVLSLFLVYSASLVVLILVRKRYL